MNFLDRRFLNISLSVNAVANQPAANPTAGSQYIVGSSPSGALRPILVTYVSTAKL